VPLPGTTKERGYGIAHRRLRARWAKKVDAGEVHCWRCGRWIEPGSRWDLGHDEDRSVTRGPEHQACNRATATHKAERTGRRRQPETEPELSWSRDW
jgi:hypothetical protein